MDSVSQLVLGAAVGEAVLGKKAGNKALLWGAVAGTIPDLDVLPGLFMDTVSRVEFHRGMTHSVLFFVLMSPVFGWLVHRLHRRDGVSWLAWTNLFFWGLFTHALLDCFTTWGTQLFWPFSRYPVAFKSIFVVDPLYTLPLLVCVIWVVFLPGGDRLRQRVNTIGLVVSSCYLLLTLVNKYQMNRYFEQFLNQRGIEYVRYETKPAPLNNLLWTVTVEVPKGYFIGYHCFLDRKPPQPWLFFPKNADLLGPYLHDERLRRLLAVTEGYYTVEPAERGVYLNDLRFGKADGWQRAEGPFVFSYHIAYKPNPGELEIDRRPFSFPIDKNVLRQYWQRIKGN